MGAGCCKALELNPDGTPKDPQTNEQRKEDPRDLRRFAAAGDWTQMRMLLRRMPVQQIRSGATKDEVLDDEEGNTALHFSVAANHLRGMKKLIRYEISPAAKNKAGKTPLHLALETGKLKAARILIEKSIELAARTDLPPLINTSDRKGVTPLLAVVAAGRLKLTREVLAMCKDLDVSVGFDIRDNEGNSMLLYAAKWGWFDELETWTDSVMDAARLLNLQNKQGETVLGHVLLFSASGLLPKQRAATLVTKMLGLGALARLPAFREKVPLINLAAAADDKVLYEMLLAQGADPLTCRDALGRTPLHYAAAKGAKVLAETLLDAGLKAYALDGQRNTPLHLAAMRGQEEVVSLLLQKADDKLKALLTPNKSGLSAYHLALKAGADDRAQSNSITLIEELGDLFTTPVIGRKKAVVDTPLLLAIQGHQNKVVRVLLQKGCSPNEANVRGEVPLARVLACATAVTYDNDTSIFDQLIAAGSDIASAGETAHPMLAICKNDLSKFAEKAISVMTERFGTLDWNKRDEKGYTPLALAAFHDNAWLVRYLIDEVKIDPNADGQRSMSTEPEVVGTTGVLCFAKPLTVPGTIEGQTPLMCAAKGASLAAVQLLLNRGADVNAVDSLGRTALQHAMHLDKVASLKVAAALLQMGARPERGVQVASLGGGKEWKECADLVGETWPHRAVRYGFSTFLGLWAGCGGSLELLATTADDADDMPGAELKVEEKADFLDFAPKRVNNVLDVEDEELVDDYNGEDSEEVAVEEDNEGEAQADDAAADQDAQPLGESVEQPAGKRRRQDGDSSDDDCGTDNELADMIARGQVESHYSGPTPRMLLRWRRRGMQWWDEFWVDRNSLPDIELEDDPYWEDKYNVCEEGEEEIDEEDVEEEIWASIRAEQRSAAAMLRAQRAAASEVDARSATTVPEDGQQDEQTDEVPSLLRRVGSGVMHKLFKHRLPTAAVPPRADADAGTFAAGSPSKWLRRKPSNSNPTTPILPATEAASTPWHDHNVLARAASNKGLSVSPTRSQQQPLAKETRAGPVAEGRERNDIQLEDIDEVEDQKGEGNSHGSVADEDAGSRGLLSGPRPLRMSKTSFRSQANEECKPLLADDRRESQRSWGSAEGKGDTTLTTETQRQSRRSFRFNDVEEESEALLGDSGVMRSDKSSSAAVPMGATSRAASMRQAGSFSSRVQSRQPSNVGRSKSFSQQQGLLSTLSGKLMSGASAEDLIKNEPYYHPDTRCNGLPRYMMVDTFPLPDDTYQRHLDTFNARVKSYTIKDKHLVEGPELRARNIHWYHKSMSPVEYPLKLGKWKGFSRLSAKAVEEAKLRRPCKPGEKPKVRSKKAWFGMPKLPSRPELALTSPLVYAVRLGRVKCVEELLKYSSVLPNIPDAHGVMPLSYAMFMLAKDRNNTALQQMVDLLLNARPIVDSATTWRLILLPRMEKDLQQLEADALGKGGDEALSRRGRMALQEKRFMVKHLKKNYSARDFPSIMEPVILAALLNDIGRLTVLVQHCGANINGAWVWLPDIPIYFQGLWEKQLSRCNSRCSALHVAICQKKYDSVRALLDLGADPNMSGSEYTGNIRRDLQKQAKLFQDKAKECNRMKQAGAKYNLYTRLWCDMKASLRDMLYSTKRFLTSIEIPGLTRPHPWLSPLHLACRFGLPEVTFLLIERGAAVNGGPASAFAPKSPLEEALMYARANAQAYGTTAERFNHFHIMEATRLLETDENREIINAALSEQKALLVEKIAAVREKADQLSAASATDKKSGKKPADFLKEASKVIDVGGSLASFDPTSLEDVPIPRMNVTAMAKMGMKLVKDALALMDPIKAAIKAVTLAAKLIIKLLLEMMRRPIAQHDPAMACAHVLLYFRAPINLNEKQSAILMRDILDNGNGLEGADTQMSYYRWIGIEPEDVNDAAWVQTVINKINVLKANIAFGYMPMDLTTDPKEYERLKKKFMAQVQNAVLVHGHASLMPQYLKNVIEEGVSTGGAEGLAKATQNLDSWFEAYIQTNIENKQALCDEYNNLPEDEKEDWVNRRNMGVVPTAPTRDEVALELLPQWLQAAPDAPAATDGQDADAIPVSGANGDGAAAAADQPAVFTATPKTAEEVKRYFVARFLRYDPQTLQPITFVEPPLGDSIWDQMLEGQDNAITFKWPAIDETQLEAVRPTILDVTEADVCTAIVRAYNAIVVKRAQDASKELQAKSAARANRAAENFKAHMEIKARERAELIQEVLSTAQQPRAFDEEAIFEAAITNPMWEAALNKLGGGPAAAMLLSKLRAASDIPHIPDPLELVKSLGPKAMEQGRVALLGKLEEQLGQPLPERLRGDLAKVFQDAWAGSAQLQETITTAALPDPDALIDTAEKKAAELVETVQDPQAFVELAAKQLGPDVAAMLKTLQRTCEEGKLPLPDPDEMARDLAEAIKTMGPDALFRVWEAKVGLPLPDAVREELQKGAKHFADRVMEKYEEGGISAAVGACTVIAAGVAVVVTTGLADAAEAKVDELVDQVNGAVDTVEAVVAGDMSLGDALSGVSAEDVLSLPMPKRLSDTMAPLTEAMKEANHLLGLMADPTKQLEASVKALTDGAIADLQGLSSAISGAMEQVFNTLSSEVDAATDQFMSGLELMMEVDLQALVDALENGREVLVMIMDLLNISDMMS